MEILHQIVFSQAENPPLKELFRSLENERFSHLVYHRLTKLCIPYKIAFVFKVILYITSKLKTIHVIINHN